MTATKAQTVGPADQGKRATAVILATKEVTGTLVLREMAANRVYRDCQALRAFQAIPEPKENLEQMDYLVSPVLGAVRATLDLVAPQDATVNPGPRVRAFQDEMVIWVKMVCLDFPDRTVDLGTRVIEDPLVH